MLACCVAKWEMGEEDALPDRCRKEVAVIGGAPQCLTTRISQASLPHKDP